MCSILFSERFSHILSWIPKSILIILHFYHYCCSAMYELLSPLTFVAVSHSVTGHGKLFMSHLKWSIFKLNGLLCQAVPGWAQFGIRDQSKEITSFWEYGRTFDEGFSRERDYPVMLHLYPWRKSSKLTPVLTHTFPVSFIQYMVPNLWWQNTI